MPTKIVVSLCAWLAAFVAPAFAQPSHFSPRAVVASPAGNILATGGGDGTLKLVEAATGKELLTLQKGIGRTAIMISSQIWQPTLAFAPDGKVLASYRANEPIHVWSVPEGKELATLRGKAFLGLTFSSDGKLLAGNDGRQVRFWDLTSKEQRPVLETKEGVKEVNFSATGKTLVAISEPTEGEVGVTVWEVQTGKARLSARGVSAQVVAAGKTLVVVSKEGAMTLWDLDSGEKRGTIDLYTADK